MRASNPENERLVIGIGQTGFSCARYFSRLKLPFTLIDSRLNPPQLTTLQQTFPKVPFYLGPFTLEHFQQVKELIVSPGVNLNEPIIQQVIATKNLTPCGDIELFARHASAPIIAITGTNAKGTVTTLVGDMIRHAQRRVEVGGNIGRPVLDLLDRPTPDFYVLEISSFQLEALYSLKPKIATILNISPDHLDRHRTLQTYIQTKQRIYRHCEMALWNRKDPDTYPHCKAKKIVSFGLDRPKLHSSEFGLQSLNGQIQLAQGQQMLLPIDQLRIKGRHNWTNALAALAIGHAIGLPLITMLATLRQFKGLPHRCQWIKEENGIAWYNDSKATNVGATLAALNGLGPTTQGKIILIAGGLAKGANFKPLFGPVARYVKTLILIGHDAPLLKTTLEKSTLVQTAIDLTHAVALAQQAALPGDVILLSPACASMDMFKNYEERGDIFTALALKTH